MAVPYVLVIIDMFTPWSYEGAEEVAEGAPPVVAAINRVRACRSGQLRVVHANDLEGGFHGSRERTVALAMLGRHPELVKSLEPEPQEDFIHKGQHSAFYGTPLAHLLAVCNAETVVLAGQVTEQCVLYTALDAHVRDYEVLVLTDAVLSRKERLGEAALELMELNMGAVLTTSRHFVAKLRSP